MQIAQISKLCSEGQLSALPHAILLKPFKHPTSPRVESMCQDTDSHGVQGVCASDIRDHDVRACSRAYVKTMRRCRDHHSVVMATSQRSCRNARKTKEQHISSEHKNITSL
ncbi:hypothetical protein FKM82_027553 [Ascaphus truei]